MTAREPAPAAQGEGTVWVECSTTEERIEVPRSAAPAAQQAPAPAAEVVEAHSATALVLGFNEMARQAQTLGERIFFRMARDAAEEQARKLGVRIERTEDPERVIVTLRERPRIELRERDLDLMRAALAEAAAPPEAPAPQGEQTEQDK